MIQGRNAEGNLTIFPAPLQVKDRKNGSYRLEMLSREDGYVEAARLSAYRTGAPPSTWGEDMHRGDACITPVQLRLLKLIGKMGDTSLRRLCFRFHSLLFLEQRTTLVGLICADRLDGSVGRHVYARFLCLTSLYGPLMKVRTPPCDSEVLHPISIPWLGRCHRFSSLR